MVDFELIKPIAYSSPTKIVLLVMDGLGGLPDPKTGKTELETARTPNLDKLAAAGNCGLSQPVGPGITPGSAPGHLALFGYDPLTYYIGRGVLEAVGADFPLQAGDIAARGNFCTVNEAGLVTDRRAGRISSEKCAELSKLLDGQIVDGVKVFVQPVKEHRFIVVLRGQGLLPDITDSDPELVNVLPAEIKATEAKAAKTADIANKFVAVSKKILARHHPANMILLRGFSNMPHWPSMSEIYKLKPVAIASYPMYRGLARLVGMEVVETGTTIDSEFETLARHYADHDFIFMHIKGTDSAGEDGDFPRKVKVIEDVDKALPRLIDLQPDVIVVSGDHSTPAVLKGHSWHPVPLLLYSKWCRPDRVSKFGESACASGSLGVIPAANVMPLALASALKLLKYGA